MIGGSTNTPRSRSSGFIWISSQLDLLLTIDSAYSYDLGPGDREARHRVTITHADDPADFLFDFSEIASPITGEPSSGTFATNDTVMLPAGPTYLIHYTMQLLSFGGSPEILSFGEGHVNFHLQVVPAPSTAMLVLLGAPIALRRRCR